MLKIALDAERLRNVEPATLRVFCFDATSGEWQLVPRSGARAEAGYAWAHLATARPLHRDRIAGRRKWACHGADDSCADAAAACGRRRSGAATRARTHRRAAVAAPRGATELADAAAALDMARLDVGARGLPEFDIFDDICPPTSPPWGKNLGKEIIERIRWNDITVDVDGVILFQDWCSVGPRNVSGRIKSLAIHPVEGNGVLAGAADGGVWRTQDGGGTWFPLMGQELSMAIGAVARSGANLSVIYAATGEDTPGWGPSYPGVGVYKSIDGGNSWTLLRADRQRPLHARAHSSGQREHRLCGRQRRAAQIDGWRRQLDQSAQRSCLRRGDGSDLIRRSIYAAVWDSGIFRTTRRRRDVGRFQRRPADRHRRRLDQARRKRTGRGRLRDAGGKDGQGFRTALHLSRSRSAGDPTARAAASAVSAGVARLQHPLADAAGHARTR